MEAWGGQWSGEGSSSVRSVGYVCDCLRARVTKCVTAAVVGTSKGACLWKGPRGGETEDREEVRAGEGRSAWERAYVCPRVSGGAAPVTHSGGLCV